MADIVLPVVTSNGTDRDSLISQQRDVLYAAHLLEDALAKATPNGRDYIGDQPRYAAAIEQHYARVEAVDGIVREATAIAMGLRK